MPSMETMSTFILLIAALAWRTSTRVLKHVSLLDGAIGFDFRNTTYLKCTCESRCHREATSGQHTFSCSGHTDILYTSLLELCYARRSCRRPCRLDNLDAFVDYDFRVLHVRRRINAGQECLRPPVNKDFG